MQALAISKSVSGVRLDKLSDLEQDVKIKEIAVEMARSIESAHEKIKRADELSKSVPDIKGGFLGFGKQEKINDALSQANVVTNEAVTELSKLIQKSVQFTCSSLQVASKMHKALAYLAAYGISDANGRIEVLSDECADSINTIVDQAYDFIESQEAIEQKQESLEQTNVRFEKALIDFQQELDRQTERDFKHDKMLDDLRKLVEKTRKSEEEQRRRFAQKIENELSSMSSGLRRLIDHNFKQIGEENKAIRSDSERSYNELTENLETKLKRIDSIILETQKDISKLNEVHNAFNIQFTKAKFTITILIIANALLALFALIIAFIR